MHRGRHSKHSESRYAEPKHEERERSESPMGEEDPAFSRNLSLLSVNHMRYNLPVSCSNNTGRVQTLYAFQPQQYNNCSTSTLGVLTVNTGSAYVFGPTSTVQLTIAFAQGSGAPLPANLCYTFGSASKTKSGASALNCIREINVVSRSGESMYRGGYAGVFAASIAPYVRGTGGEYMRAAAGGASYQARLGGGLGGFAFPVYSCSDVTTFEIPLSALSNLFGQASPLPPHVISGAKINLTFEDIQNAFLFFTCATPGTNGAPPSGALTPVADADIPAGLVYNVSNLIAMIDQTTLVDSSAALVNSLASSLSSSGIQYCYNNIFNTHSELVSSDATIDVLLAAAKTRYIVVRMRRPAPAGGAFAYDAVAGANLISYDALNDGTGDGGLFQGTKGNVGQLGNGSIRVRVGNDLLSLQAVQSAGQAYRMSVQALTYVRNGMTNDLDPLHNTNNVLDQGCSFNDIYTEGASLFAIDLEKSANLGVSGLATNNARNLSVELKGLKASNTNKIILDIWVVFMSAINANLENIVVDR